MFGSETGLFGFVPLPPYLGTSSVHQFMVEMSKNTCIRFMHKILLFRSLSTDTCVFTYEFVFDGFIGAVAVVVQCWHLGAQGSGSSCSGAGQCAV